MGGEGSYKPFHNYRYSDGERSFSASQTAVVEHRSHSLLEVAMRGW